MLAIGPLKTITPNRSIITVGRMNAYAGDYAKKHKNAAG
jgi:hypothetical protein